MNIFLYFFLTPELSRETAISISIAYSVQYRNLSGGCQKT